MKVYSRLRYSQYIPLYSLVGGGFSLIGLSSQPIKNIAEINGKMNNPLIFPLSIFGLVKYAFII